MNMPGPEPQRHDRDRYRWLGRARADSPNSYLEAFPCTSERIHLGTFHTTASHRATNRPAQRGRTPQHHKPGNPKVAAGARTLVIVPILHSAADMGGLARSIERVTQRRLGRRQWAQNVRVIAQLWTEIREAVGAWTLPWEKVRLYQDGLPRCGREKEIVTELAATGSPNHQLLLDLMHRGAILMGTEAPDLLVQEYKLIRAALDGDSQPHPTRERQRAAESRSLLTRRDRYIARRIGESLRPGEVGILFLGMLHSVERHVAADIRVTYPIYPPQRTGADNQ